MNASIRFPIAVTRPYIEGHNNAYHITRIMSIDNLSNQYYIGNVTLSEHGLSYKMREDRPENYKAFSSPMTDADIAAIKQGMAWHEAHPIKTISNLIWIEGITL